MHQQPHDSHSLLHSVMSESQEIELKDHHYGEVVADAITEIKNLQLSEMMVVKERMNQQHESSDSENNNNRTESQKTTTTMVRRDDVVNTEREIDNNYHKEEDFIKDASTSHDEIEMKHRHSVPIQLNSIETEQLIHGDEGMGEANDLAPNSMPTLESRETTAMNEVSSSSSSKQALSPPSISISSTTMNDNNNIVGKTFPTEESLHFIPTEEESLEDDQVIKPSDKILIENAKERVPDTTFSFAWFSNIAQDFKHGFRSIRERTMNRILCRPSHEGDFSDDEEEDQKGGVKPSSVASPNNPITNPCNIELNPSIPNNTKEQDKEEADENPEIHTVRKFETIYLNDREKNKLARKRKWPTNYVRTTKYTLITFIPQNLFEQFRKAINIYLLITVIAVLIPDISPIFPPAAVLPITFIVLLQMAKDGYEDFQRYRQDLKANNELCRVVRNGTLQEIRVKEVEIGDFVCVRRDESFPADLLCVYSSREDDLCYVETAHLDGETNLKTRRPLSKFLPSGNSRSSLSTQNVMNHTSPPPPPQHNNEKPQGIDSMNPHPPSSTTPTQEYIHATLATIKGKLKVEVANKNLDVFEGTAKAMHSGSSSSSFCSDTPSNPLEQKHSEKASNEPPSLLSQQQPVVMIKEALSMDNLLLRGCTLKNTQFIYGVAIYVGKDTKILNNTKENRVKRNALEVTLNQILALLVFIQQIICAIVAGLQGAFQNDFMHRAFYLKPLIVNEAAGSDGMASFVSVMSNWVTIFILLNLIVNETIVIGFEAIKSLQSWSIENDTEMRFEKLKTEVRTASMNQALSKMDIIFSDKTGTLTQNEMKYSDSYVDGVYYSERSHPGAMKNYLKGYLSSYSSKNGMKDQSKDTHTEEHSHHHYHHQPQQPQQPQQHHHSLENGGVEQSGSSKEQQSILPSEYSKSTHAFFLREFLRCLSLNNSLMPEEAVVDFEPSLKDPQSLTSSTQQSPKNTRPTTITTTTTTHTTTSGGGSACTTTENPCELNHSSRGNDHGTNTHEDTPKYTYHGPSSDEIALLEAATNNGFVLTQRTHHGVVLEEFGELKHYEIVATFPFTSERKRMSVLVRNHDDGKYVCYVKGADSVVLKRAATTNSSSSFSHHHDNSPHHHNLKLALQHFSMRGLRTLVCARRELAPHEFREWFEEYTKASLSTKNRDQLLAQCASLLERDLQIVGCTAIEDKLQEQVAESISYLQQAGLHIWVLTGDKTETAINIAYSTHVLHKDKTVEIRIRNATSHAQVKGKLKEALEFLEKHKNKPNIEYALVIDSKSLEYALEKYEKPLLRLASQVHSAVCCRLKPLQKSTIVKLIEKNLSKKALAIGDGVNDVAMIQAASIGVGIKGKEGTQAARAADYALPRFKHLVRLLAVHGRYCCVRNADFLHYSFYKNFMLLVPQFFFIFYSAYSGILMYDSWEQLLFVAIYCFFQPIASGACEKDLPEHVILQHPEIYDTLKKKHNNLFSVSSLVGWGLVSIYQCAVIFFGIVLSYGTDGDFMENNSSIPSSDVYHFGKLIMTCVISVVTLRYMIEVKTWSIPVFFSIFGSYLFYFLFSVCYSPIADVFGETGSYYIYYETVISVKATLICILVIVMAILPNFLYKAVRMNFFPHDYQQLLIEYHRSKQNKKELEQKALNVDPIKIALD
ncbi:hypothetical protein FDP41_010981 [Naegleria fowleri]|uniref:Phospholipid-transporting ATPase n=1 Tax=Naegleria fowleri TaxID=5763 RepID=A0A6A5BY12_NAEFO|nr:uncharacterized protein FDP41_010981 [Naegleria fowleri]KAF0983003.1 hypothetical protein FDP41_010981 [Naegleria fowleri]